MDVGHFLEHQKHDIRLFSLNLKLSKHIRQDLVEEDENFIFRAGTYQDYKAIQSLHMRLFRAPVVRWVSWVYRFRTHELMSVIVDKKANKVIGYDLFMFNEAEVNDRYIHELYVAVDPAYQGQALSIRLRKYSIACYQKSGLKGVSTLANVDDIKALRSAQKAGFAIVKRSAKPPAHYLVCPLLVYR